MTKGMKTTPIGALLQHVLYISSYNIIYFMFHSISTLLEDSPIDNPADSLSTTPAEESHDTYDTYQVSRPPTPSSVSGQSLASALGTSQVSLKRKRQPEGTETSNKSKGQPDPVEAAIVESLKLVQSGH